MPPLASVSSALASMSPPLRLTGPSTAAVSVPPPAAKPSRSMAVPEPRARLSPPAPRARVTFPPGLPVAPRASRNPVTVRPPAASVSVPEPTTSAPLRVTLRAPKSRPQAGPESVTVPSMVQVVAPQQPEDARKGAALHALGTLHTASAARLAPSTSASAARGTARRRVSGMRPPPDSARRGSHHRRARVRRARRGRRRCRAPRCRRA